MNGFRNKDKYICFTLFEVSFEFLVSKTMIYINNLLKPLNLFQHLFSFIQDPVPRLCLIVSGARNVQTIYLLGHSLQLLCNQQQQNILGYLLLLYDASDLFIFTNSSNPHLMFSFFCQYFTDFFYQFLIIQATLNFYIVF